MAAITLRAVKGSPLTNTEMDDNLTNLNNDKIEADGVTFENLDANGDVGPSASQVAQGNHQHTVVTWNERFNDGNKLQLGTGIDAQLYSTGLLALLDLMDVDFTIRDDNSGAPADRFTFGRVTGNFTATGDVSGANLAATTNITAGGAVTASGDVTAFSDERLKENIEPIANALNKTLAIGGYTFDRKDTGQRQAGVLAQQISEVLPEVVHENSNGTLSVAYGNIVALLIESVKELNAKIKALEDGARAGSSGS